MVTVSEEILKYYEFSQTTDANGQHFQAVLPSMGRHFDDNAFINIVQKMVHKILRRAKKLKD